MAKLSYVGRSVAPEEYIGLREALGLPPIDYLHAGLAVRMDLFSVVATLDGTAVGCGRVLGDGVTTFLVQDVMVHPAYQRRGIGTKLMEIILEWMGPKVYSGTAVLLLAAPGTAGFHARFGFEPRPAEAPVLDLRDRSRLTPGNA